MTKAEIVALARAIAPIIKSIPRGRDGRDGLGIEDATLFFDDDRGFVVRLTNGERVKDFIVPLPYDAGVWESGKTYAAGAGVTWDGQWWIAVKETTSAPGEANPDWRLAVRRGKQGREGKPGKDGAPGKDLTQIDPATGKKWGM